MSHYLKDYLGYQILQIHRAHRNRAEAALNALGLYTGQELILFQLWQEEGVTQSQLVELLCVEPPTITKTLQRLERAGLVERRQDGEDARISRVYLTEQGRALELPVKKIWDDLETLTTAHLSEVEQALLQRLLSQVRENLAQ